MMNKKHSKYFYEKEDISMEVISDNLKVGDYVKHYRKEGEYRVFKVIDKDEKGCIVKVIIPLREECREVNKLSRYVIGMKIWDYEILTEKEIFMELL